MQMDQVASELRLARTLVADQDSEIKKVWATNSQVSSQPASSRRFHSLPIDPQNFPLWAVDF